VLPVERDAPAHRPHEPCEPAHERRLPARVRTHEDGERTGPHVEVDPVDDGHGVVPQRHALGAEHGGRRRGGGRGHQDGVSFRRSPRTSSHTRTGAPTTLVTSPAGGWRFPGTACWATTSASATTTAPVSAAGTRAGPRPRRPRAMGPARNAT